MEPFYKNLEHTGDLAVEVWGGSLEELLENASKALVDTLVELERVQARQEIHWHLEGEGPEQLLVRQLQEILFRMDGEGMIFREFKISLQEGRVLKCEAHGEPLDRERHGFKTELKAVTYHRLQITQEPGRWVARIIFDV